MSETTTSTTSLPTTTSSTSTPTTSTTPTPTTTSTTPDTETTPTTSTTETTETTSTDSDSTSSTTTSPTTSTTSSTLSSTEATTPPATSSSSTSSSSTSLSTLTSTGDGETSTVVVTATGTGASPSQTAVSDSTSGGKSFFDNKGAVAGVFTVVGLVALVLFVVVATNVIRRRRAKKFDEEVAAAAAEANASTRYPFDDYDDPAPGGGYGTYSDPESHGTLSQAPLTHTGESYNMSEFNGGYGPSYATGAAAAGAGAGLSAGAAGIGASRSLARRSTNPNGDYTAPYNAFAGPLEGYPSDPYDPYTAGNVGIRRQGSRSGAELLDAIGIGAAGATGAAALNRGPSQNTQNPAQSLDRNQSLTTQHSSGNANSGGTTQESYAAHYQPDFRPDEHQYQPPLAAAPPSAGDALPNPFARDGASDEDAYGGEIRSSSPHDETRMSIRDEEDYGRAGRTLKVANE